MNLMLLGVGLGAGLLWIALGVAGDIERGMRGYDSYYYRLYTPYTSPMGSTDALAQIRNLPQGDKAWVRSGAGCEYLISHQYDSKWQHDLAVVHAKRSRWGLPCHEASWWSSGSIIAKGQPEYCRTWRARREPEGGGWTVRWTCAP